MDKVKLPILPSSMQLGKALDRLRRYGVSGLITEIDGRPAVLDAETLLRGNPRDGTLLGDLIPAHRTVGFESWEPELNDLPDGKRAASMLDKSSARFGFAGPVRGGDDLGIVVTRSEQFASVLSASMFYCTCTGPDHHVWAPNDSLSPGVCNDCGSPLRCG